MWTASTLLRATARLDTRALTASTASTRATTDRVSMGVSVRTRTARTIVPVLLASPDPDVR